QAEWAEICRRRRGLYRFPRASADLPQQGYRRLDHQRTHHDAHDRGGLGGAGRRQRRDLSGAAGGGHRVRRQLHQEQARAGAEIHAGLHSRRAYLQRRAPGRQARRTRGRRGDPDPGEVHDDQRREHVPPHDPELGQSGRRGERGEPAEGPGILPWPRLDREEGHHGRQHRRPVVRQGGGRRAWPVPAGGAVAERSQDSKKAVMTTREQNDFLTRTGPGTPIGDLFRRYWIPALKSEEIAEPDCPPVRVKLLGERLIAFRDSHGRVGLTDEFCAHRGVSLWFGRNEENGLRCPYHGWKYDHTGQCIEVPSEPVESGFCKKIKLKSYPLIERGGVIWAYMGPPELKPPLPNFEWVKVPHAHRFISKRTQECNYL